MNNRFQIFLKLILLAFLSLVWFVFIQVEYEIITKPELQNDFPIIKGIYAVLFVGIFLLIIGIIIIYLLYYFKRIYFDKFLKQKQCGNI